MTLNQDLRFPRAHRLTTKADFKQVFDHANKFTQKHLLLLCTSNQKTHARIGIIVGKRAVNTAVARNQIRRIVRDSFRTQQKKLAGLDIVIIARQCCGTLSKAKLRKGIDDLWEKLLTQQLNRSSV